MPRSFYAAENAHAEEHDGAHDDPMHGHVHKMRGVNQAADDKGESTCI